jgi:signal transduction histidine kinase
MRGLSAARDLSTSAIIDHLPQILALIADYVESVHIGKVVSLGTIPKDHAVDRLARGFDLDQIVTEYGFLRRTILDLWKAEIGPTIDLDELQKLDSAFDESLRQATLRYAESREKLLKAVDRISQAALGPGDLDRFLKSLLRATLDSTESVDTAAILLVDGDLLRVRAAVGLEEGFDETFSIPKAEGIAGAVASTRLPVIIRDASTDPRVISRAIKKRGVRALYGVPLLYDDQLIGVAHIGSLSAPEFSEEDKLLFRSMANRAASGVIKAQLLADLSRAVELRERVLGIVSHDLRNQVQIISTVARIVDMKISTLEEPTELKKLVVTIQRTVNTMQQLLADLLDMASIQAGRLSSEPSPVRFEAVLIESYDRQQTIARNKGVHLHSNIAIGDVEVMCDRGRVLQVLENLLGNAIKFCHAEDTVTLRADVRDRDVLVAVSDTGPGIPTKELKSVFEAYHTSQRLGQQVGTGLGLFITKGIVENHGGQIWVESEVGRGSTFFFTLSRA